MAGRRRVGTAARDLLESIHSGDFGFGIPFAPFDKRSDRFLEGAIKGQDRLVSTRVQLGWTAGVCKRIMIPSASSTVERLFGKCRRFVWKVSRRFYLSCWEERFPLVSKRIG